MKTLATVDGKVIKELKIEGDQLGSRVKRTQGFKINWIVEECVAGLSLICVYTP